MKDTVNAPSLALIADIGGTNARFALTDLSAPVAQVLEPRSLDASQFASLQHAAEHYLADSGVKPRSAAIAVASPVNSEEIRLTNRAWSFTRRKLQRALRLRDEPPHTRWQRRLEQFSESGGAGGSHRARALSALGAGGRARMEQGL